MHKISDQRSVEHVLCSNPELAVIINDDNNPEKMAEPTFGGEINLIKKLKYL
jgi:hypothetical protein